MHHPGMRRAQIGQRMGKGNAQFRSEYPDHDPLYQRRVGERSQHVENGAHAELGPHRPDMAHRRMVARGHQEADAGLVKCAADKRHIAIQLDAEAGQHVGRPAFRRDGLVAVLGHAHTATGDDKCRGSGDVVGADAVTAGADDIHRAFRRLDDKRFLAHHAGGGGNVLDPFTADLQRRQEGGHADLADLAIHDRVETVANGVRRRHLALGQHLQGIAHYIIHERLSRLGARRGERLRSRRSPDYMKPAGGWQAKGRPRRRYAPGKVRFAR